MAKKGAGNRQSSSTRPKGPKIKVAASASVYLLRPIVDKAVRARQAREAAKKARELVRKGSTKKSSQV